jgi:hypothetical protein
MVKERKNINIMKRLKVLGVSFMAITGLLAAPLVFADPALAVNPKTQICQGVTAAGGGGCTQGGLSSSIVNIVNILLFIVGAIAVIMIVIGGLRYILTQGDQSSIQQAKNTVLYSIIGLIIALLAYAIVNFVVGSF